MMVSSFIFTEIKSMAGLATLRRQLRSVLQVLDGFARNRFSLSRSLELGAQLGVVLASCPQGPLCRAGLAICPALGLPVFGACARSLQSRLSEFLYAIVVWRQDDSIRSWRNWILEDPLVHAYPWRQPDLVLPSPYCILLILVLPVVGVEFCLILLFDEQFRNAWLPYFCRAGWCCSLCF